MVPPPPPQHAPQPYYPYPQQQQPMAHAQVAVMNLITKRAIFLVVGIGGFLIWLSIIAVAAFGVTDAGARNLLQAIGITGGFLGFGGSALGALGSPRTDGNQNVGLLVLAGFFLLVFTTAFRF